MNISEQSLRYAITAIEAAVSRSSTAVALRAAAEIYIAMADAGYGVLEPDNADIEILRQACGDHRRSADALAALQRVRSTMAGR